MKTYNILPGFKLYGRKTMMLWYCSLFYSISDILPLICTIALAIDIIKFVGYYKVRLCEWKKTLSTCKHHLLPLDTMEARSFDVFFDARLNKRPSKQLRDWWFETPGCSLWRHCNVTDTTICSNSIMYSITKTVYIYCGWINSVCTCHGDYFHVVDGNGVLFIRWQ